MGLRPLSRSLALSLLTCTSMLRHVFENALPAHDLLRALDKHHEQAKLHGTQGDCHVFLVNEVARTHVEAPGAKAQDGGPCFDTCARTAFGRGRLRVPCPAQKGADAGHKLAHLEGFDYVIVPAKLKAHHAVRKLPKGCEKDDRYALPCTAGSPQPAAQGKPVLSGQHDVQKDEIVCVFGKFSKHALPVKDANRVEAQSLQVFLQKFGNLPVVLDHKYVCHSPCHTISPRAQMFMAVFYHPAQQSATFKVLQWPDSRPLSGGY